MEWKDAIGPSTFRLRSMRRSAQGSMAWRGCRARLPHCNKGGEFMRIAVIFTTIFMVLFLAECNKPKKPDPKEIKSSKTVEDFSGITTIKQGEYLKAKAKEIEKMQEERFKEAQNREE
jgi:hypothetical protein